MEGLGWGLRRIGEFGNRAVDRKAGSTSWEPASWGQLLTSCVVPTSVSLSFLSVKWANSICFVTRCRRSNIFVYLKHFDST
jgi:hypothetical protein